MMSVLSTSIEIERSIRPTRASEVISTAAHSRGKDIPSWNEVSSDLNTLRTILSALGVESIEEKAEKVKETARAQKRYGLQEQVALKNAEYIQRATQAGYIGELSLNTNLPFHDFFVWLGTSEQVESEFLNISHPKETLISVADRQYVVRFFEQSSTGMKWVRDPNSSGYGFGQHLKITEFGNARVLATIDFVSDGETTITPVDGSLYSNVSPEELTGILEQYVQVFQKNNKIR